MKTLIIYILLTITNFSFAQENSIRYTYEKISKSYALADTSGNIIGTSKQIIPIKPDSNYTLYESTDTSYMVFIKTNNFIYSIRNKIKSSPNIRIWNLKTNKITVFWKKIDPCTGETSGKTVKDWEPRFYKNKLSQTRLSIQEGNLNTLKHKTLYKDGSSRHIEVISKKEKGIPNKIFFESDPEIDDNLIQMEIIFHPSIKEKQNFFLDIDVPFSLGVEKRTIKLIKTEILKPDNYLNEDDIIINERIKNGI